MLYTFFIFIFFCCCNLNASTAHHPGVVVTVKEDLLSPWQQGLSTEQQLSGTPPVHPVPCQPSEQTGARQEAAVTDMKYLNHWRMTDTLHKERCNKRIRCCWFTTTCNSKYISFILSQRSRRSISKGTLWRKQTCATFAFFPPFIETNHCV